MDPRGQVEEKQRRRRDMNPLRHTRNLLQDMVWTAFTASLTWTRLAGRHWRRIVAVTTMTIAIAMPFGAITGLLSKLDGRLPFVLSFSLFLFLFAVISTMKKDPGPQLKDEAEQGF